MYWRFSRNDRLRHVTLQLWYYFLEGFAVAEDMLLTVQQLSGCVEITTNQKAEIVELEFVGCCLLRGSVLISDDVPACICGVFCSLEVNNVRLTSWFHWSNNANLVIVYFPLCLINGKAVPC